MSGRADRQEAVLRALEDGECRTVEELAAFTGLSRHAAAQAAARLILRAYAERVERGCYRITGDGRSALSSGEVLTSGPQGPMSVIRRPRRHTDIGRFWGTMRREKKFTVPLLIAMAGRDGHIPDASGCQRYVHRLEIAGYLAPLSTREPGTAPTSNGFPRYLLVRDTGPEAPVIRRAKREVYDPNTGEVIPW